MLVYGDATRAIAPRAVLEELRLQLVDGPRAWARSVLGSDARRAQLLAMSELVQAVVDGGASERDARVLVSALRPFAAAVIRPRAAASLRALRGAIDAVAALALPDSARARVPEGYAYYGLFPETYALAVARSALARTRGIRVVGIRTIGVSLGAVVFAALPKPAAFVTVRPTGDPCARTLSLEGGAARTLAHGASGATFAIVDEGPGMSGSSFGAVADWLCAHGAAASRLHFFPSHGVPPGPRACESHRARWRTAHLHSVDFDDAFVRASGAQPAGLARAVAHVTGEADAPLAILGHGAWRARVFEREADWPPVCAHMERRKYLLRSGGVLYQLKFAGLAHYGTPKLARARLLAAHGFAPEALGLACGFLVSPWIRARPLSACASVDRTALVATIARYLAFLARELPARDDPGASPKRLLAMLVNNARWGLGEEHGQVARGLEGDVDACAADRRPVLVDAKLQPWEWLVRDDGTLRKADALDHHAGHDLVGAQDIAWDVAGATLELSLSPDERACVLDAVARARGRAIAPRALAFYEAAYAAFWGGVHALAHEGVTDPDEATRLSGAREAYFGVLRDLLEARPPRALWRQP